MIKSIFKQEHDFGMLFLSRLFLGSYHSLFYLFIYLHQFKICIMFA